LVYFSPFWYVFQENLATLVNEQKAEKKADRSRWHRRMWIAGLPNGILQDCQMVFLQSWKI
jgi:hypothetical protein